MVPMIRRQHWLGIAYPSRSDAAEGRLTPKLDTGRVCLTKVGAISDGSHRPFARRTKKPARRGRPYE